MTTPKSVPRIRPQPEAPREGRCKACGAWVTTVPAGTAWVRGRCGNRSALGQSGRKCALYGQTQSWRFD